MVMGRRAFWLRGKRFFFDVFEVLCCTTLCRAMHGTFPVSFSGGVNIYPNFCRLFVLDGGGFLQRDISGGVVGCLSQW